LRGVVYPNYSPRKLDAAGPQADSVGRVHLHYPTGSEAETGEHPQQKCDDGHLSQTAGWRGLDNLAGGHFRMDTAKC